ncbi:MAG: rod shape-determining protein RodA, partial [Pseudomonadota bacterium]
MKCLILAAATLSVFSLAAFADEIPKTKSPDGAKAYIISPKDGAKLKSPIQIQFGLKGMGIAPAGVNSPGTGHH